VSRPWQLKRLSDASAEFDQLLARTHVARGALLQFLSRPVKVPPVNLLHLATNERDRIRTVPALCRLIPCERTIARCRRKLAVEWQTETRTFALPECSGAYVANPLTYAKRFCDLSPVLVIGGDQGGGFVKLGVLYRRTNRKGKRATRFAPLLVYKGKDTADELNALITLKGLTPFNGASTEQPHIWSVFQRLIDTHPPPAAGPKKVFLCGDWPFLSAVLGLKGHSSDHPCPICTCTKLNLLHPCTYRHARNNPSVSEEFPTALLRIPSENIVPLPLHAYIGLGNRAIKTMKVIFGEEAVEEQLGRIRTVHSAGKSGASDWKDLSGKELDRWMKLDLCTQVLKANRAAARSGSWERKVWETVRRWLQAIHANLLHCQEWTAIQLWQWRQTVKDIQEKWTATTGMAPFPKLHMLTHTVEFAERWRFLGMVSESSIESSHAAFNALYHEHHRNKPHADSERQRRCIADMCEEDVQPYVMNPELLTTP